MSSRQLEEPTLDPACRYWRGWARRAPQPDFVAIARIGGDRFVTAPPDLRARVESADPTSQAELVRTLAPRTIVRSGAARLGYTDRGTFRPQPSTRVVRIDTDDDRFTRLRVDADLVEWQESMSHDDWAHVVGIVEGTDLVAVAAHQVWDDALAHVSVFTALAARGRGLSIETGSATVEQALADGLVPRWRARVGNAASWRVAQHLGFVEAGRQIYAVLAGDD